MKDPPACNRRFHYILSTTFYATGALVLMYTRVLLCKSFVFPGLKDTYSYILSYSCPVPHETVTISTAILRASVSPLYFPCTLSIPCWILQLREK
jgi:tellurite resistance protein TehA-like permease